jgi:hypothetical protein
MALLAAVLEGHGQVCSLLLNPPGQAHPAQPNDLQWQPAIVARLQQ